MNPKAFFDNLYYMGMGMLGVFLVIGVIIVVTFLLNWMTKPKKNRK
jgi:hypothetical protein